MMHGQKNIKKKNRNDVYSKRNSVQVSTG